MCEKNKVSFRKRVHRLKDTMKMSEKMGEWREKNRCAKGKRERKCRRIRNSLRDRKRNGGFALVSLLVPAFMIQI